MNRRANIGRVLVAISVATLGAACGSDVAAPTAGTVPGEPQFETTIREPSSLRGMSTGLLDARGEEVHVRCSTCHGLLPLAPWVREPSGLTAFHTGMTLEHGELACASCHAEDRDRLRLADGESIAMADAMQLCAQCHGAKHNDYLRGAHGGMTGHWDLSRGPRTRNHCIDCHDVHAPAFPAFHPKPGPRDRFLPTPHASDSTGDHR